MIIPDDEMLIVVNKEEWLMMVDLVQAVNIHRTQRSHAAMKTAWKLAKELKGVGDYEEVHKLHVRSQSHDIEFGSMELPSGHVE